MGDRLIERAGVPVFLLADDGPLIVSTRDALDLIADSGGADVVAVPVGRLDPRFFTLSTGLAGELMQKFVQYRARLAVVGDVSAQVAASTALRDLVYESNRGRHIWFVADLDELDTHLSR